MLVRLLALVALATVLSGAPSPVSGGGTNELSAPTAIPKFSADTADDQQAHAEPLAVAPLVAGAVVLVGVALLAGWLVPGTRRRAPARSEAAPGDGGPAATEDPVAAVLERRMVRRARVRIDPPLEAAVVDETLDSRAVRRRRRRSTPSA